ncbi:pleurocidin-like peptide WF3 isoform X2 [Hippoglossus stenolepis]|uniref:pleurocidin-like peptide WF3 isoform X2 n=1 Tax=Hippoglossus stenolepis TaxID=195615 RepID=UPI001FAED79B|nr:pleurocidin-like peptide WF3 isoform X2 [Hippoglossus stenolepis]
MKFAAAFLVLFMVVLMAEPGECFLGLLFHGVHHVGNWIHGLIHGGYDEQQELDKRSVDDNPGAIPLLFSGLMSHVTEQ